MAMAMEAARRVMAWCGVEEEREMESRKAPGACPRCGGAVVATDVQSARRILCLPLCVRNKKRFSCTRCRRTLVAIYSGVVPHMS